MQQLLSWFDRHGDALGRLAVAAAAFVLAILAALVLHRVLLAALRRAVRRSRSQSDDILIEGAARPLRWAMVVVAIGFAHRMVPLAPWVAEAWRQAVGFIFPVLLGWLLISLVRSFQKIVDLRADISVDDNLEARRRRTRADILGKITISLILFLTVAMMLLSIPGVRNVGVTLMASAGVGALAVGAAAQPALRNLIAGIQMAFTEPIRLDDVVVIGGEWGRIEEIRLTYVVVKIWDERRLIVPVKEFLEGSFQNWTRESAQITGTVLFYLDPAADVARLRQHLDSVVRNNPLWDGRFFNLQVTDARPDAVEVRVLLTSRNSSRNFDLRCAVREEMLRFIGAEMPEALVRHRLVAPPLLETAAPTRDAATFQ